MVKVILQIYPMVRAEDEAERKALRPIGRNVERYHEALHGSFELAKAADQLGVWGMASIEHHFHSEGYEVGPSPGTFNAYWAAITQRLRVGQLGYVMSTQHPIRIAEETAILDHMTKGRFFVGFARGYQDRWTNVVGQHLGSRATHSDGSADDLINRDIFREQVEMVIKAWTEESIEHNSKLWQVPYPYTDGIDWWMARSTKHLGAPGEIGEDGRVHRVSVVPAPYTQPHPPIFVPSSGSAESVDYCGRMGFNCIHVVAGQRAMEQAPRYAQAAAEAGRPLALGQMQGIQRYLQIGETREAAREALAKYDADIYKNFWNLLYERVVDKRVTLPENPTIEQIVDEIEQADAFVTGTVDDVRDQLVEEWKQVPFEYLVATWHYAQQPLESTIEQLRLVMTEIKPALDELTQYEQAPA